jgi:tungstate transport system ATP-binding protein
MSEPVFQLEGLAVAYGPRRVLDLQQLAVRRGEILTVLGPSGAGKSTLLRVLNFLEPPSAGRIFFLGQSVDIAAGVPLALRRRVTTVFQRPALLRASVLDNVAYGLRLRGVPRAREAAMAALAQVRLVHLRAQPARSLSGGEIQRVALARAIAVAPDVLLLDEPTANLDPANGALIEQAIVDLCRRQGVTIVLVTHNLFQARRLADRVALLIDGRLVEEGPAQRFFDAPQDARSAAFARGELIF